MRSEQEVVLAVSRYADMVKRICFVHLKNEADTEDIFQTVFLKYALRDDPFENAEHEKAWLIRVTVNACRDLFRRFFRRKTMVDALAPEPSVEDETDAVLLRRLVSALPAKYRVVIYMYYYEEYTAAEIGQILRRSENTVYTQLARARKLLEEQLGGVWE